MSCNIDFESCNINVENKYPAVNDYLQIVNYSNIESCINITIQQQMEHMIAMNIIANITPHDTYFLFQDTLFRIQIGILKNLNYQLMYLIMLQELYIEYSKLIGIRIPTIQNITRSKSIPKSNTKKKNTKKKKTIKGKKTKKSKKTRRRSKTLGGSVGGGFNIRKLLSILLTICVLFYVEKKKSLSLVTGLETVSLADTSINFNAPYKNEYEPEDNYKDEEDEDEEDEDEEDEDKDEELSIVKTVKEETPILKTVKEEPTISKPVKEETYKPKEYIEETKIEISNTGNVKSFIDDSSYKNGIIKLAQHRTPSGIELIKYSVDNYRIDELENKPLQSWQLTKEKVKDITKRYNPSYEDVARERSIVFNIKEHTFLKSLFSGNGLFTNSELLSINKKLKDSSKMQEHMCLKILENAQGTQYPIDLIQQINNQVKSAFEEFITSESKKQLQHVEKTQQFGNLNPNIPTSTTTTKTSTSYFMDKNNNLQEYNAEVIPFLKNRYVINGNLNEAVWDDALNKIINQQKKQYMQQTLKTNINTYFSVLCPTLFSESPLFKVLDSSHISFTVPDSIAYYSLILENIITNMENDYGSELNVDLSTIKNDDQKLNLRSLYELSKWTLDKTNKINIKYNLLVYRTKNDEETTDELKDNIMSMISTIMDLSEHIETTSSTFSFPLSMEHESKKAESRRETSFMRESTLNLKKEENLLTKKEYKETLNEKIIPITSAFSFAKDTANDLVDGTGSLLKNVVETTYESTLGTVSNKVVGSLMGFAPIFMAIFTLIVLYIVILILKKCCATPRTPPQSVSTPQPQTQPTVQSRLRSRLQSRTQTQPSSQLITQPSSQSLPQSSSQSLPQSSSQSQYQLGYQPQFQERYTPQYQQPSSYKRSPYEPPSPYEQSPYKPSSQYKRSPYEPPSPYEPSPYKPSSPYEPSSPFDPSQYKRPLYEVSSTYEPSRYQLQIEQPNKQYEIEMEEYKNKMRRLNEKGLEGIRRRETSRRIEEEK